MGPLESMAAEAVDRVFRKLVTPSLHALSDQGLFAQELWQQLTELGIAEGAVGVSRSGIGLGLDETIGIAERVGAHAAPVPLVETFLVEHMLSAAELPPRNCLVGILNSLNSKLNVHQENGEWYVDGQASGVKWGRFVKQVVFVASCEGAQITCVAKGPFQWRESMDVAFEPCDSLQFIRQPLQEVSAPRKGFSEDELLAVGALYRAAQMSGALQTVLQMTVEYANIREQFGRPLGRFQAVQQQLAVLASEVSAAKAIVQQAAHQKTSLPSFFDAGVAKSRVCKAAKIAIDVAHQVHGAIGTTLEHPLCRFTMRLATWSKDFGSKSAWDQRLGQIVCQSGGDALWPRIAAADFTEQARFD